MPLKQTFIFIHNVKIYCEYSISEKPPILLIHGFASSTYTFNRLLPLLENHFSVIAIDLPGFGRSEKSPKFYYSFANYAKVIAECIRYFQLDKVYLVGHSMGGQIAMYTAKMIPEKINKLILLCSSGYLEKANRPLIYCSYIPFFHWFVKFYIHRKDVKQYLHNVFYDQSLISKAHVDEFGKPLQEVGFYKALIRLLRHREGDLQSNELKEIEAPALLIWGTEDKVVPVQVGEKLVKDLPNAKLITYEKAGHLITEERPNEVFSQIISYIFMNEPTTR